MVTRRKRPLGITLLALSFIWIGLGTIIFPLVVLSGGANQMWDALLRGRIHSDAIRLAIECVFSLLLYSAYVLYAWIGYGLWKLKKSAWRVTLIVNWISIASCVLAGLLFVRVLAQPPLLAVPFTVGLAAPLAAIVWYLYRPTVREAFQLAQPDSVVATAVPPPPFPKKERTWLKVAALVAGGFMLFGGALIVTVESMFRRSSVYVMALQSANESPCTANQLGTPVAAKGLISGNLSESTTEGSADLWIPMVGPKGKSDLHIVAEKKLGSWTILSLTLSGPDGETKLLPTVDASNCN